MISTFNLKKMMIFKMFAAVKTSDGIVTKNQSEVKL